MRSSPQAKVFHHRFDALINRFHRLDSGLNDSGVTDHVGVGEVQDNEVIFWQVLDDFAVTSGALISGL